MRRLCCMGRADRLAAHRGIETVEVAGERMLRVRYDPDLSTGECLARAAGEARSGSQTGSRTR